MLRKKKYQYGLALSGGGARGIAHLGAVKALLEAGYKFDIIAGTSMGAIVGCLLADGHDPAELIRLFTPENTKTFIRPALSKDGMLSMDGARKHLSKLLSVKNIEDLSIPFIATATNITSGETEYFDKGNIIDCVIASSSIPVVFPPAKVNGKFYIDGGVLNNLPARCIRSKCKKVIGLHVNPQDLGLHGGDAKGIVQIAERSFFLCVLGNVLPDIQLCDFFLEHSGLANTSTLDFSKAEFIYEEGYKNTKKALTKI